jgi:hypothetical protein
MGLIDLKTDLKSLKFGKDRPRGGSSNQPYVQKDIPEGDPIQSPDFLLRNGFLNPVSIINDTERIGKYFIDLKSPSGLLFIAKQNLLSRLSVRTQASGILNDYVYSPTSTLAQVIGNSVGIHTNKQGINPVLGFGESYTPQRYFDAVKNESVDNNRLFQLYDSKIIDSGLPSSNKNSIGLLEGQVLNYGGGPGSILGIGRTNIKFAGSNNGGFLRTGLSNPIVKNGTENQYGIEGSFILRKSTSINFIKLLGVTYEYDALSSTNTNIIDNTLQGENLTPGFNPQIYKLDDQQKIILGPTGPEIDQSKLKQSILRPIPNINYINVAGFNKDSNISGKASSVTAKYFLSAKASGYNDNQINSIVDVFVGDENTESLNLKFDGNIYKKSDDGELLLNPNNTGPQIDGTLNIQKSTNAVLSQNSDNFKLPLGLSTVYNEGPWGEIYNLDPSPNRNINNPLDQSVYKTPISGVASLETNTNINNNGTYTYDTSLIENSPVSFGKTIVARDFRAELRKTNKNIPDSSAASTKAPSYDIAEQKTIEYRVNLGDPGKKGKNLTDYTQGAYSGDAIDQINALDLYQASSVNNGNEKITNDLVKFRIAAFNPSSNNFVFMHFRAFIDSFNDAYTGNWDSQKYMGRGENFYTYNNFTRAISMGWTVAAQSKAELIPMYHKLNFLASNLAPDYSSAGYMRGPLVYLTVGGYLYEQPGFITSLTYDIPQESTWEIGINTEGGNDSSVKELSHMIKVSGFSFTPIHKFLVAKQNGNKYSTTQFGVPNVVNGFASQRYIALKSGTGKSSNNYDTYTLDKTLTNIVDPTTVYDDTQDN